MIDKEEIEEAWSELEQDTNQLSHGEYKVYKTEFIDYDKEILLTIDSNFLRHLLIEIPVEIKIVEDTQSKGLALLSHKLQEIDGHYKKYIDLICKYTEFNEVFSHLIVDLLNQLQNNPEDMNKTCLDLIYKWRQFFKLLGKRLLPLKVIIGLFGELWYLEKLIKRNGNLIQYWSGPDNSRHDFLYKNIALEVKATTLNKGRFFSINGIKQLLNPLDGELFLCTLILEKVKSEGMTLTDLVDKILNYPIDKAQFLSKLLQIGYDYNIKEEYEHDKFKVIEEASFIYKVDEVFPKIIPNTFLEGKLPNFVLDIKYIIDLSGVPPTPLNDEEKEGLIKSLTE